MTRNKWVQQLWEPILLSRPLDILRFEIVSIFETHFKVRQEIRQEISQKGTREIFQGRVFILSFTRPGFVLRTNVRHRLVTGRQRTKARKSQILASEKHFWRGKSSLLASQPAVIVHFRL